MANFRLGVYLKRCSSSCMQRHHGVVKMSDEVIKKLSEDLEIYKTGYEASMRIIQRILPDKFPDTYFISGEGGSKDENNLPERIYVTPAYGVYWVQVYERTDIYERTEW